MGIEPTRPAWKAGILPLNYTRIDNALIKRLYIITYFRNFVKCFLKVFKKTFVFRKLPMGLENKGSVCYNIFTGADKDGPKGDDDDL